MEKEFIEREFRYRIKEAKLLVSWIQKYEISILEKKRKDIDI